MSAQVERMTRAGPDDIYPSRTGGEARLLDRVDPVVYATDRDGGPISRPMLEHYEENGFLLFEDVLDSDEVAQLQRELARLRAEPAADHGALARIDEPGSDTLRSIFAIHRSNAVFARLAADRRLAGLAAYLLGDDVYIHQSRLNYKPGFRGREFYWHSDFETWHVEDGMPRMRALSISVALTENHGCNGPLMLIPGSHHKYVSCSGHTPEDHFRQSLRAQQYGIPSDDQLRQLVDAGGIVSAEVRPGSIVLFDCNLMHGSGSNITPYPRSNAFFVYNAMCNQLNAPYCKRPPRPEFIASRAMVQPPACKGGVPGRG